MIIKLIRHGESDANIGKVDPSKFKDSAIPLSKNGIQQAINTGDSIGKDFIKNASIYCSPYIRTRQTLQYIIEGTDINKKDITVYEDPRLREIDIGYDAPEEQLPLRKTHGWFYYRFKGGESPADCFDRTSAYLESMMRESERNPKDNILIVAHGMTIRCFVTRFLHLTVEQFEEMENPNNCEIITIDLKKHINSPVFSNGRWGMEGIRIRNAFERTTIMEKILPLCKNRKEAEQWYYTEVIPSIGYTANEMIKLGRYESLLSYLERIEADGFA